MYKIATHANIGLAETDYHISPLTSFESLVEFLYLFSDCAGFDIHFQMAEFSLYRLQLIQDLDSLF
jgi:hypothetical protein